MQSEENVLTVRFLAPGNGAYPTVISGAGLEEGQGSFTLPFSPDTWRAILQVLEPGFSIDEVEDDQVHEALAPVGDLFELRDPRLVMQRAGSARAQALLSTEDVQDRWQEAQKRAAAKGKPLAVGLSFGEGAQTLAALPWELLYHEDRFLARDTSVILTRYLEGTTELVEATIALPLRVLLILSEPVDVPSIFSAQARYELTHGLRSLDEAGTVIVDLLRPPTYDTLVEAVRNGGYHFLLFYGHGEEDPRRGGILLFENEHGGMARVGAAELGAAKLARCRERLSETAGTGSAGGPAGPGAALAG